LLSDSAVEDILFEVIEEQAEALLCSYQQFAGSKDFPVPIESIAEHFLGYDLEITNEGLFANPEFLGGISFEEKVIYVNTSVEEHEGRYMFTVAHEIGHHVLHRELYDEHIQDRSQILCREEKQKPLIERQADRFAAALLMPRGMIQESRVIRSSTRPKSLSGAMNVAKGLQDECGFTNVSLSALVNRLRDLDLISGSIPYQTGIRWRGRHRSKFHGIFRFLRRLLRY
jgi:Zn-dependent peptidase ImmA (M78 family)